MARKYKYQINSKRGIIKAVERPAGTTPIRESKGAYDPKATYSKGDTVIYNGLYYTATTGTGIPGEGDGWEISGIVSAKGVILSIRLDNPMLDATDGAKAVRATATATLGGQDITAGLPADGWRWTWRGKELSGETKSSTTLTDIPLEVGQYPLRATHKLFGTATEVQVVRVDVTSKLRSELEGALERLRKSTGDDQAALAEILGKVNKTLTSLQEQVDKEVSNWFYPGAPGPDKEPENEWTTNQDKYRHIGDTYTSVDESGEYMGKSWRYTTEYKWQEIHDTLISKALSVAAKAQTTADGKSTTYYTQPARYSVGDSWVLSADTTVGGKVYKKGTMLFANSSSDVFVGAHWGERLKYIDSAKLEADLKESEAKSKQAWEAYAAAQASKASEETLKAAKEYAEAQDAAYEERTRAYADKILTDKEQALIAAADAKAAAAETRAKAYADGKVTQAEQLAIDKADAAYQAAVQKAKELDGEIQVGGRNLLLKSDTAFSNTDYRVALYDIADPSQMVDGEVYTIRIWGDAEGADFSESLWGYNSGGSTEVANIQQRTNGAWTQTFKWKSDSDKKNSYLNIFRGANNRAYDKGSKTTITRIKLERGTVATDWTPAPEDVQASVDNLKGYVDGAFRDGIVDDAEAKAIKTYINEVDAQWQSALGAYEKVYTNALLTGSPKTALLDCKTTLAGKVSDLTGYITTAISDGKATAAEVTETDRRYTAYKSALKDFQKALKVAEDFIRSKGAGGRFLGEAKSLGFDGFVELANGDTKYGKAGDTVRMTNTGSNNVTSWEKDKIYILAGVTNSKGYVINTWTRLTGEDGAPGAPGKDADPAELRELRDGLTSANTSISALQEARRKIEAGKLSASDLPAHLRWIYDAFNQGKTETYGGLTLTQVIGLSNSSDKVTSYLSGQDGAGMHMLAAGVSGLADANAKSYLDHDGKFHLSDGGGTFLDFNPEGKFAFTLFGGKLNIPGILYAGYFTESSLRSLSGPIAADYSFGQLSVVAKSRYEGEVRLRDGSPNSYYYGQGYKDAWRLDHYAGTKNYIPVVIGGLQTAIQKLEEDYFEFVIQTQPQPRPQGSIYILIIGENKASY